ncbi:MAG: hypothetical protein ACMUIS_03515 [bacterium]
MNIRDGIIPILIGVMLFLVVCGLAGNGECQFYYPYFGFYPYFAPYPPIPFGLTFPIVPSYPFMSSPALVPPLPTRVGAATIIVTNPTAGTVSVLNPTVAAPTVTTTATAAPPPLLSILGTLYSSLLYEGLLSTANPLLFATLQYLFL